VGSTVERVEAAVVPDDPDVPRPDRGPMGSGSGIEVDDNTGASALDYYAARAGLQTIAGEAVGHGDWEVTVASQPHPIADVRRRGPQ
jgi:hypothetical protein